MENKISYNEAIEELEQILNQIETGELDIDQLSEKLKRASILLKNCKNKLKQTETEVEKIINDINE